MNPYAIGERHVSAALTRNERGDLVTHVGADGSTEGFRPNEVSTELFKQLGHDARPLLSVIRTKCLDCCGEQPSEVAKCTSCDCALWPYRLGSNPLRQKEN